MLTHLLLQATSIEPGQFDDFSFERLLSWLQGVACLGINIVGSLLVIAFAVSALIFMTSGGDKGRADHARTAMKLTFIAAVIFFALPLIINTTVGLVEWIFNVDTSALRLDC